VFRNVFENYVYIFLAQIVCTNRPIIIIYIFYRLFYGWKIQICYKFLIIICRVRNITENLFFSNPVSGFYP